MKKFLAFFAAFLLCTGAFAQTDTLKILAIGNSFSDDGMEYIPDLLEAAGIHNVVLGRLYIGGCSLERHCIEYDQNLRDYLYYHSGSDNKWKKYTNAGILYGITRDDWDIITIQQVSGHSGLWESFEPHLGRLIEIIHKHCKNPDVEIVWHETWPYARTSGHHDFKRYGKDQKTMYDGIVSCVKKVLETTEIERFIPGGAAINDIRASYLNDFKDLTRDGFHQNRIEGRYTLACTWFETLIAPFEGVSVLGNPCRLERTEFGLTDKAARRCQKAAVNALKHPYAKYKTPKKN